MNFVLFAEINPELALAETRTLLIKGHPVLPDDEYALLESYCPDPRGDSRNVILDVIARRDADRGEINCLASISFDLDRRAQSPGPELDPTHPQSQYAEALLEVVTRVLVDSTYVARLKKHHRLARKEVPKPELSTRERVARLLAEAEAEEDEAEDEEEDMLRDDEAAGTASGRGEGETEAFGKPSPEYRPEIVPKAMRTAFEAIVAITEAFCREHLDEEYAQLSRRLAAALARKRPSPLAQGGPQAWACGIVYALGNVNFLWGKTQTPHMSTEELCQRFGIGKSDGSARARSIMNALRIVPSDPRWYRPSKMEENPLAWAIEVDGMVMDARALPREVQEEALRRGLIPYLPEPSRPERP